ncbi:hypothetical protein ACIA49_23720 [Kribbella sp. NPDC051587]|uniref:hypothetical protein n=1 Tax=Kribbella sp. NPDC051587 TaxID=3364119 RepID=UPI0037B58552
MHINGQKKILGTAAALAVSVPFVLGSAAPATAAVSCGKSVANVDAVTYADRLVRAWGSGEQATTSCYASTAAAHALTAQATPGGIHWRRTGTEGAAGTIYVTYHDDARGGNLTVGVQNVGLRGAGGWHAATSAKFVGEPKAYGALDWSDNLIRAWGRGDTKWMAYYATPDVAKALTKISKTGGSHWRRITADAGAGSTYVTYRNDATGHQLVIGVSNVGLAQGDAHAADRVQYK